MDGGDLDRRRPRRRAGRRRAAFLASALLHALGALVVYLVPVPRPVEPAGSVTPAAIELRLVDDARRPPEPPPVVPREDVRAVRPRRRSERAAPAVADRPPDVPPDVAPGLSPPHPSPDLAPDLAWSALPAEVQVRVAGPPPEAELRSAPRRRHSVDELRAERERAEEAADNVRAGRVDPLLYDYLRGARTRFEDEAQRLAEAISLGPGATTRSWGRGYLERVKEVNENAAAGRADDSSNSGGVDPRPSGGVDPRREPARLPHADLFVAHDEALRQSMSGAEERVAHVCLDVEPGRETKATLRRGSGVAALDRLALEAFGRSAAARPTPPDARRGLACYELRISAFRVPPLPVLSCGFDRKGPTCIWPFKKVTSVTGRLLGVEYPPPAGAPRNHSLLRSAR